MNAMLHKKKTVTFYGPCLLIGKLEFIIKKLTKIVFKIKLFYFYTIKS